MVEAGAVIVIEVPPTSPNQFPSTSMPENLLLDYQLTTNPPNIKNKEKLTTSNFTLNETSRNFKYTQIQNTRSVALRETGRKRECCPSMSVYHIDKND